ncbi:MAG TPA: amino acid adenylation domain-containing protein [Blastocatellia bacterium]|nr:amino acid adenylation domain-containing protein [Blastocatellia bacterium]
MMASEVLTDLIRQNAEVWSDGEHLRVRAPKGVLTPELQAKLAAHKAAVMELLEKAQRADADSALPIAIPDPRRRYEPFPLTDIQQAYWIGRGGTVELGNVSCHAYYEVQAEQLDLPRLELALQRLIERHDMLRAIVLADGRQQVLEQVPRYEIKVLDLRRHTAEQAAAVLEAVRHRMSHQVLPSDRWPLFEICASRLNDGGVRLHFSFDILIADVWSLQILFSEWAILYADLDAPLPPLDLQFRDYVVAEAELKDSESYRQSQQYWAKRLSSLPPAPDLPLANNPGSQARPRFVRRTGQLQAGAWAQIKAHAAELGLTPSGALLTAFADVLATWSRKPEFTLNVTLLNRLPLHPQVQEIIGDFTSLVPLSVDTASGISFAARAGRVQAQLLEDLDHRFVSGVEILRELARAHGRTPGAALPIVFTSLLSPHQAGKRTEKTLWMGDVVYGITQTPQVWLDHQVLEEGGNLVFNWDAVESLFPERLLDDMFETYCSLLRRLSDDPRAWRQPSGSLLPPAQRRQRDAINQTEVAAAPALLQGLFQEQAKRRPQQTAVVAASGSLTYEELQARVNGLSRKLRLMGARPNTLVAVVMEKGVEQVAAVLAILQAGAAYLPLDPGLPQERLWHLLSHGEVSIVLTQSWVDEALEWPRELQRLAVDFEPPGEAGAPPEPAQQPDDLAYVIYTSGSTGLPKGVMIDHKGAVNTLLDINRRFGIGPDDRVLAVSNLSFDLSVYDIFGTLAAGGTIVMPAASASRDAARWLDLIDREEVTVWNSAPAVMEMLVACAAGRGGRPAGSLRLVLLSGDWISVTLPDRIKALAPAAQVISLGGATEASVWSIFHPADGQPTDLPSIPYGRPLANQRFHVLNQALEPRPVWVAGDLYIGGVGLALGYWRDDRLTEASFITHPRTGERLYRTGDLGRYLPDGTIEFLGRVDAQVKIQGYRIELGEIEAALGNYPGVRSKAVVAEGARENKRLVAYLAADPGSAPTVDELRRFLRKKLPAYMIPSAFVISDSLPLTANGKVDRKALAGQARTASLPADPPAQRGMSVEERIAECIADVLKLDHVGADTNLLELGANSIDITRIATRLEKEFNCRPGIEEFYSYPSPRSLARAFQDGMWYEPRALDLDIRTCRKRASNVAVNSEGGNNDRIRTLINPSGPGR